ncbi:hypothetical protein EBR21_16865, partial [bacterium]|nr:hypothetical protein [bacterium]
KSPGATSSTGIANSDASSRNCAVDHAMQFLFGYRPTGDELASLRRRGLISFQQNGESLAAVIRDVALAAAKEELEQ